MHSAHPSGITGFVTPVLTDVAFALLVVTAAIGVVRTVRDVRALSASVAVGLALWCAATAFLTLRPGHSGRLNLVPFNYGLAATPLEPVSNVLLFVPLGILVATLGWRWFTVLSLGLVLSVTIETTQYLLNQGRTADVDDVIENTVGALIGWLVVLAMHHVVRRRLASGLNSSK